MRWWATTRKPDETFTVLFVCTGNICRSALAERLGRGYLDEALGGSDAGKLVVASAGTQAVVGADLVLALTRNHRREVLRLAPRGLNRTFTLKEAAGLLALVDPATPLAGNGLVERCRSLVQAMAAARSRRPSAGADDIVDPVGRPLEVHQQVGEEIATALLPMLGRLVALGTAQGEAFPALG